VAVGADRRQELNAHSTIRQGARGAASYSQAMAGGRHESGAAGVERSRPHPLTCEECLEEARGRASGWRAYLTDEGELTTYCPECAEREFGEDEV
jgi:hypothetical protein